jgi:hypothetical protein
VSRYDFIGVGPRTDVATGAYSYDAGNRLTGLAYTANVGSISIDDYGWGFDNANNVTSMTSTVDGSASYGYDPTNQLSNRSRVRGLILAFSRRLDRFSPLWRSLKNTNARTANV